MGYYNPYRHSGTSGSGNYASGAGSAYSHGQQGSNPWFNRQQSGYGQPYNTAPNQGEYNPYQQPQQQGYPGQYQSQQGYPGQSQQGHRMGGYGSGGLGMGASSSVGGGYPRMSGPGRFGPGGPQSFHGNDPFDFYQRLIQQRQMEQQLGMESQKAWYRPENLSWYQQSHGPFSHMFPEGE